jgi:hypothetical protein
MSNLKIAELSWKKYIYYYNDLKGVNEKKAKIHYILHGRKEGRFAYDVNFDYFKGNNKLSNGILFSCNDYPGFGGAATNCYQLIKEFQKNNIKCCGLFFNNLDLFNNSYKEESILYSNILSNFSENIAKHLRNKIIDILNGEPVFVICKTYLSLLICRLLFPKSYFIYLISGITHFHLLPQLRNKSFQDFLKKEIHLDTIGLEKDALKHTNLIIFNSDITQQAFFKIYPKINIPYQISDTSLIKGKKYTSLKTYDIVICCSDLKRIDKNNQFVLEILQNNFTNYHKIIIGKNYQEYQDIPNSTFTNLISHVECKRYISLSKILIYPSLFDSNPNTVREALSYQCLPLISNNVGYYQYYPKYLVCKDYNPQTWINKIRYLLSNYQQLKNVEIHFPKTETLRNIIFKKMIN